MRMLGTSKVCITPSEPVRLCGFGFRTGPYEKVRKDIYVRVFDWCEGPEQVIFIYGDLLWWNSVFVERMKKEIAECFGIAGERLLFVASHNHSGPGTGDSFIPLLETVDQKYVDELAEKVKLAVEQAGANQEEVTVMRGEGTCSLNVFRRVMTEAGIAMLPNYEVEPDRTLTEFGFYRRDGSLKGKLVHYPCHANLSKDNDLHPDYPGYLLEQLDEEAPGSVSMFLQGCTADMRPNCVLGNQFRAGSPADVEAFARYAFEAVKRASEHEAALGAGMSLQRKEVRLPVYQDFAEEDVQQWLVDSKEEMRQWAAKVKEKGIRNYEILELSVLTVGKQKFYFMNAEVSMHYARFVRNQMPGAVCTGYTNGMIGYLSPAEQIREGGYEPCESAVYFAVAGTYDAAIQGIIERALETV